MNGWLLDTNVLSELRTGRRANAVMDWVYAQQRDRVFISALSLGEFEKGLHMLRPDDPNRVMIQQARIALENFFRSYVLPVNDNVIMRWGKICGDARRLHRVRLDPVDAMFAATAVEYNLVLVTRNVRDMEHTGATVFNPFQPHKAR